jgi:hypothetical protein
MEDVHRPTHDGLPVAFDGGAASADPTLPGFLSPPEGAPVYHGFVILDGVAVDGFRFGIISGFCDPPSLGGDAFVIAPDDSRAGLVWEASAEPFVREISPFEDRRWGVWAVGFPHPMRGPEDAQRNLAAVLPVLKEEWQRWRRGEGERVGFNCHHRSIWGTAPAPPPPDAIVAAVQQAGFPAARAVAAEGTPGTRLTVKLAYAPVLAPFFMDLAWLDPDAREGNPEAWDLAEEHLGDPALLQSLRCCADVRHDAHSNPAAIQAAVDFLHAECAGLGVFAWAMV